MRLESLRLTAFRNFNETELIPAAALNILFGPNASGKTALLESIYVLGRGRSFRTPRIRDLIQYGSQRLVVSARLRTDQGRSVSAGIEQTPGATVLRYDGRAVQSLSEHARRVPLVLITPDSHSLINGGPEQRRRWLDWSLFHVEPAYLGDWRDCFHALRQRNALLKRAVVTRECEAWEQAFATAAARLDAARQHFVEALNRALPAVMAGLLPGTPSLIYWPGRDPDQALRDLLRANRDRDRERGFTTYGPQRGDLVIRHDDRSARMHLSRGQAKLYIAGVMLAYAEVLRSAGLEPVMLVDDLPAELDRAARCRFLELLQAAGVQAFVTAIDPEVLEGVADSARWFHVEQGRLASVV